MKKALIVYYSWSNGNTERIAKQLQAATGTDLLRIDTAVPYSGSYDEVVKQGREETKRLYEPKLAPISVDIAAYDVVAVGTPTWWYTMAPAVLTFLHSRSWRGKTVIPFMTNGGWPGRVIKDMKEACSGAKFACGKPAVALTPGTVITIPANVKHWHGAKADSWFSHIAVEVPGTDCGTEWCEPVSEEEYNKLK